MLYRSLKLLHILGLTLFLGSIFGHIVSSALGGQPGDGPAFIAAREHIRAATRMLTLPGLGLAALSGAGMMLAAGLHPKRAPWLIPHMALAAAVAIVTCAVVVPAGEKTLAGALLTEPAAVILKSKQIEDMAGGVNVLLTLTLVAVGLWKPKLLRRDPAGRESS